MLNDLAERAVICAYRRNKINPMQSKENLFKSQKKAVHEEAVELLIAKGNVISEHIPQYTEDVEEAADVIISTLVYLRLAGVDINEVIEAKMKYNEKRED